MTGRHEAPPVGSEAREATAPPWHGQHRAEEDPMRVWYCPACGGRLSYGTYCKVCRLETTFSMRPATLEEIRARACTQDWAELAREYFAQRCRECGEPEGHHMMWCPEGGIWA